MTIYWVISACFCAYYVYLMLRYAEGWQSLPTTELLANFRPQTFISVLIPARNEAAHIEQCLRSILAQNYPIHLYEIILIDDYSTDDTAAIAAALSSPRVQVLSLEEYLQHADYQNFNQNSFKKIGIQLGIKKAKGTLIACTDADCLAQPDWLRYLAQCYELQHAKFIAAPVNFYEETSNFERFQSLDFLGMMGITGAGIHRKFMRMCNGANLAYPKSVFYEVGGFEGINRIASGDDMLLMQKIAARYPNDIFCLKQKKANIFTHAKPNWQSFINQRVRWASKSSIYPEHRVTFDLAMVFFFCCNLLLSLILSPWLGFAVFFIQLFIKSAIDYYFLTICARFFDRKDLLKTFFISQFYHIAYIVVVGIKSNLAKEYEWKGRRVK
jgi:cellulose synthase/poly-beta-1,6-N-acetylglucosamine synthase-like glycosyltransferase